MKNSVVFLLIIVAPWLAQGQSTNATLPIIDVHLHAHTRWTPGEGMASDTTWFPAGLTRSRSTEELMTQTLAMLEKHNIVKAVTSGSQNQKWKSQAQDRIVIAGGGGGSLSSTMKSLPEIRERIERNEIQVLAEVAWQYSGVSPNDSTAQEFWAMAEELDIPVGFHMGPGPPGRRGSNFRMHAGSPLLLEEVIARFPNLRIYVMHAGWPFLDDMVALMFLYPQIYVDISVINWYVPRAEFHSYLRRLIEAGFGKRIMYGSDQMQWPESIGLSIETIESAPFLSETQKRDILYNNAARFLRFSQVQIDQHHSKANE